MSARIAAPAAALLLGSLTACTAALGDGEGDIDSTEMPELGACRVLTPEDLAQPSNASEVVSCRENHNAQTFSVNTFPDELASIKDPDDPRLGAHVYDTCTDRFQAFLGASDESTVMRSTLTWAWFRPSDKAWDEHARWYRCDVVGGGEQSETLQNLPKTAQLLLAGGVKDEWVACVNDETVAGAKIPCSEPHTWRAVTTIKLGEPEDPYPGDETVEVRTRDFCSDSVGAWMGYPVDYDFGYTYFHEAEWKAGNRRSICWAKTEK